MCCLLVFLVLVRVLFVECLLVSGSYFFCVLILVVFMISMLVRVKLICGVVCRWCRLWCWWCFGLMRLRR